MLILVNKLRQLNFGKLMEVYLEGNLEKAQDEWSHEPEGRGLALAEQDFYDYLSSVFFASPGAAYAIWTVQEQYVAALRLEPYRGGLLISALETAPEVRRKGYAQALLSAVSRRFGQYVLYSHVGKWNAPSLRVHEKCGFVRCQEYAVYLDGSVNDQCCTLVREACTEGSQWN